MKTIIKISLIYALIGNCVQTNAQITYDFSYSTGTYTEVTNGTLLSNSAAWDHPVYTYPIGFTFNYYGVNYDTLTVRGGYLYFGTSSIQFTGYGANLVDQGDAIKGDGSGISKSPISYLLTGTAGSRILKIQFKNASFADTPGDYINFQMWFYETSNKIDVIIGNSHIVNPNNTDYYSNLGPTIGVLIFGSSSIDYFLMAQGNPSSPTSSSSGTLPNLSGTPVSGQIYTFTPSPSSAKEINKYENTIETYPNPVKENIYIAFSGNSFQENASADVFDISGKFIMSEKCFQNNFIKINVSALNNGVYFVRIHNTKTQVTKKFIKL